MEEKYMKELEYPEYLKHRAEHERFQATYSRLKKKL
jgi:hemerythrin